jgi:hypothetical protein
VDLPEFLSARLDMDEATARAATPGPWHEYRDPLGFCVEADGRGRVARFGDRRDHEDEPNATHIARWDPARVLAEVKAKRAIMAEHTNGGESRPGKYFCTECGSGEPYEYPTQWPCATLRLLAAPYADHRDYDPAWSVDG